MKNVWIFILIFTLLSCKGADLNQETLHVTVEGLLSTCIDDTCKSQLGDYEEKPYVWDIQFPRELHDLDPKDESPISFIRAGYAGGYRIGRYEVNGLEYDFSRRIADTDLPVDLNTPLRILVLDCTNETFCLYKDDIVHIDIEDQGTLYHVVFSGNRDQVLVSDSIPSSEILARMTVGVEIFRNESGAYLVDEAPVSEVFSTFH